MKNAFEYEAELKGLREELATSKNQAVNWRHTSENLQRQLTAAEQRNAELTQALERGKLWIGQFRAWIGDYGVVAEDHLMVIRTLKGLPHPPSEFDTKPAESGASDQSDNTVTETEIGRLYQ